MTGKPGAAAAGGGDGSGDSGRSHCPYCALQCGIQLTPVTAGPAVSGLEVTGRTQFPVNEGALCGKGATAGELLRPDLRLTTPLMRDGRGGELRPASWQEALDRVARELGARRPEAVAVFGGGSLTNEKAYQLGRFARTVLKTPNIDYNGRFCMSSVAAAQNRAFGVDRGLPFPVRDIRRAGAVLLIGANPAETMPPIMRHFSAAREAGGVLITVDPRRTKTAELADRHLQPVPGTDLALALGMLHLAVAEDLVDEDYVATRTQGFDQTRRIATAYWPERVERLTGVSVAAMRETVTALAEAVRECVRSGSGGAMILTARGTEQHSKGTDTVSAWINLALALGLPGRPGSGYGALTGQGNGQGGREHGQKSDQLPGYRKLDDPAAREHVAAVWGVDPDELPGPGPSAVELLERCGSARAGGGEREDAPERIDALLVMGSNPLVSAPGAVQTEAWLRSLGFLAVCDLVRSETAEIADVVLPSAQWAEETGTMTNLEGRVLLRPAAIAPHPGVRTDLEILAELAARLGAKLSADPAEVFAELGRASAGGIADYCAITYERLERDEELYWPCGTQSPDGTPRLFEHAFPTPDGRARFVPVDFRPSAEEPDDQYPYRLTTGRVLAQYQSGAQTRRVDALNRAAAEPFVELHPDLARTLGVEDGAQVSVISRRGTATAPARLSRAIRPDTVFMPFHWPGPGRANSVTNPALDPISKMPEFKTCAVRLERAARSQRTALLETAALLETVGGPD
ncbi:MAG TPA: molybdopterin oxidoreductase family protein [Actinocrinis sp.]|uniref:molybdopterin oxidoreductase family protein n=1 Tax=Actinocrinis sp. TaxID=1920516 RepID=UPI002DDDB505|nr:molybdopterin oxidoreductase family protein [Actinocrinis sp.]HEV2344210.1 molybdopterin oxidoreductase family protein [Actinocrinis sp.]